MQDYTFTDALTGSIIEFDYSTGGVSLTKGESVPKDHKSIFFPGCSFLNYAMPLVSAVNETLLKHEVVDGISILCCGKILSYEPNGEIVRDAFEEQMRQHVYDAGIERIVCACPNCVKALREAFAEDDRTKDIELLVLPQVLADLGYRVDKGVAAKMINGSEDAPLLLGTHDSCPDREYGQFAKGLRDILPEGAWADPVHSWKKSVCCGSLPRAAGKVEQADKCAKLNGSEAKDLGADAIVTACMSCAFQLNMAQDDLPAIHFLELLYDWRIDWSTVGYWMKLRFLFDESMGADVKDSNRSFIGVEDAGAEEIVDPIRARDVAISQTGVMELGE